MGGRFHGDLGPGRYENCGCGLQAMEGGEIATGERTGINGIRVEYTKHSCS